MLSSDKQFSVLKNENVLLTGGCGFIGSEITKQLSQAGARITIIDNLSSGKKYHIKGLRGVTLLEGDLSDTNLVKKAVKNQEYIINLAALPFIPDSYHYPMEFFEVNVNATINLALAAIKEKKVKRFVHISSSEVYGSSRYTPMDENHPTTPHSTYAVSKLAGERVVYTLHKEHDLPAVIIRPFNSFGPNITQPYIIPEIIGQMLKGKKEITLGNVHSKRDLTFVSDTARGIILPLVTDGVIGETINIGSERAVIIKDLVKIVSKIMSKDVQIKIDASRFRPYDVDTLICDSKRANRLLGWNPEVNITDGLKMTIKWMMSNKVQLTSFKGWNSYYRKDDDART